MSLEFLRETYLDQPYEVSIETLALCNARCTFCPYPTLDRKGARLSDEIICHLIGQMAQFTKPFIFSPFKVNEPFLDHRLIDICDEFNDKCPLGKLRLFSNGSTLTLDILNSIARLARVQHLWVSLNSHEPEEYQRLMGLDMKHVLNRLDLLHSLCGDPERDFPWPVVVSKVSCGDMVADAQFQAFVRRRWPLFTVRMIKQDGWLGYVTPRSPEIPDTACARWFELSILATGKVSLCCMDGKGDFSIGDVRQQTLLEVYNDPAYRARREAMISRRGVHPCDTCTY